MRSSPPISSSIPQEEDPAEEPIPVKSIILVREEDLEGAHAWPAPSELEILKMRVDSFQMSSHRYKKSLLSTSTVLSLGQFKTFMF